MLEEEVTEMDEELEEEPGRGTEDEEEETT